MIRIACPSPETLAAFALGELPEPELSAVAEHLDACTECEERAGRLDGMADALVSELRQLPDPGPDADEEGAESESASASQPEAAAIESWGEFQIVRELGRG